MKVVIPKSRIDRFTKKAIELNNLAVKHGFELINVEMVDENATIDVPRGHTVVTVPVANSRKSNVRGRGEYIIKAILRG